MSVGCSFGSRMDLDIEKGVGWGGGCRGISFLVSGERVWKVGVIRRWEIVCRIVCGKSWNEVI